MLGLQPGAKTSRAFPCRECERRDSYDVVSVTQGSRTMVALMPRMFFAVASVGIAVLIAALVLTALRL
jgi:hypothetical protein